MDKHTTGRKSNLNPNAGHDRPLYLMVTHRSAYNLCVTIRNRPSLTLRSYLGILDLKNARVMKLSNVVNLVIILKYRIHRKQAAHGVPNNILLLHTANDYKQQFLKHDIIAS